MERFWSKVIKETDCWEWRGARCGGRYGYFHFQGKPQYAHRVAWILTYGPIPDKLLVCHKCDNQTCVRPDHLFLGTAVDNAKDMIMKGRGNYKPISGSRHHKSRLTEADVLEIRKRAIGESLAFLAKQYDVHISTISYIVARKTWKHV